MNVKFTSSGIEQVQAWLKTVVRGIKTTAMEAVGKYLIGDMSHGLAHYPAYKYVPYAKAYGGFKSDKQRRYVMASIRDGRIDPGYPHRTGGQQRGWEFKAWSQSTQWTISNSAPGIAWTMGNDTQARMMDMIGWRRIADVIKSNITGAIRAGQAKVNEYIQMMNRG